MLVEGFLLHFDEFLGFPALNGFCIEFTLKQGYDFVVKLGCIVLDEKVK